MIEFIEEKFEEKPPIYYFKDVADNQFFVNDIGLLCQKVDDYSYIILADKRGIPCANWDADARADDKIQRLSPFIKKIEF